MITLIKEALAELQRSETGTALVVPPPPPLSLDALAAQFRRRLATVKGGIRINMTGQIECGQLLNQMQAQVQKQIGKGYWSAWVEANCGVTLRQVQRYQAKAKEFARLEPKLGVSAALGLLAQGEISPAED